MEFYHKDDGYPMSISIETMSVEKIDDDTCLYDSIVMDMDTNKVIAEFCHDSLLGRRKWAEGFFAGLKIKKEKMSEEMENRLTELYLKDNVGIANVCDEVLDRSGGLLGRIRDKARKMKERTTKMDLHKREKENKPKEINKCIRCGNTARLIFPMVFDEIRYGVECSSHPNDCTNSIRSYLTAEDAIDAWNLFN